LALPLALFAFASAVSWVSVQQTADREIERTLDVAHEHALKVFETIDRTLSEITEIVRGIPDAGIVSREETLHQRLRQLADSLPQVLAVVEWDAGPRFSTELVDVDPADVRIGMRVSPVFCDIPGSGITLLRYRPEPTDV